MPSLLELLRSTSTQVDCDTLDADVAEEHGPFVDSTSNQAIAYFELSKAVSGQTRLRHDDLIKEAAQDAKDKLWRMFPDVPKTEVLVETLMLKLQFRMMQNLTGFVLVQTNPKLSYSTRGTINNAERLVAVFKAIAPHLNPNRLCIKIPATWEGIQACRDLEKKGIATLATTMFCMEQAVLAADANCTYIAPYVNELKVHFEKGYLDHNKAFDFCREAQAYYLRHGHRTLVMAASLTSVEEVMQLAGIQHVTVSPTLLQEMSNRDAATLDGNLGQYFAEGPSKSGWETVEYDGIIKDESVWKLAFTRSGFGTSEGKIVQAINYFSDFQEKLEDLANGYIA